MVTEFWSRKEIRICLTVSVGCRQKPWIAVIQVEAKVIC